MRDLNGLNLDILNAFEAAFAQVSTVSLSPIGFEDDGLEGEAVGTGPDGTTYILSGTFSSLTIPFTSAFRSLPAGSFQPD